MSNWENSLREAAGEAVILRDEPMKKHTTFQVGGPADFFIEPQSPEELAALVRACRQNEIPYTVIGRGSNLLVADRGIRGAVLHLGEAMSRCDVEDTRIYAEAGITLAALARNACTAGLGGLAFAAGIPGSLGGAIIMNAGAYGGEMREVVTAVQVLMPDGELRWLTAEEMAFGYRKSRAAAEGLLVVAAELTLAEEDPAAIRARMSELAERRRSKQPLEYPSAGSTFKRPQGYFAGKLIEEAASRSFSAYSTNIRPSPARRFPRSLAALSPAANTGGCWPPRRGWGFKTPISRPGRRSARALFRPSTARDSKPGRSAAGNLTLAPAGNLC